MESTPDVTPDIDAVIFDFAGVLSTSPALGMIARATDFDVDVGAMLSIMLGPLDVDGDHPWHRLERGEITTEQYASRHRAAVAGDRGDVVPFVAPRGGTPRGAPTRTRDDRHGP